MKLSSFKISDFSIDYVLIDQSKLIHDIHNLNVEFFPSGLFNEIESEFELYFTTEVSVLESSEKFVVLKSKVVFKFQDELKFEAIPDYFYQNSIAIFFPYIRAYLSIVTTQANIKGLILPVLNLSHLSEPLKSNSKVKIWTLN